ADHCHRSGVRASAGIGVLLFHPAGVWDALIILPSIKNPRASYQDARGLLYLGYASFWARRWATASRNASLLTAVAVKPGSTRLTRSLVMIPALSVSKQACSNASPKAVRSVRPSRRPRFFKAPDQAKMVAMGLVEV